MHVRVTGVVIEDDRILLLNQDTDAGVRRASHGGVPGAGSYMGAKASIGL